MGIALSDDVKQLVDRPNFAHLATIMRGLQRDLLDLPVAHQRPGNDDGHFRDWR
jgi:hypothetical protein